MTDVRGGGGNERDGGCALRASQPAKRADAHRCPAQDQHDEQPERDDASVGQLLKRDAMRLEDRLRVRPEAFARNLERPRARTLRRVLDEHVPRLAPPAQAIADVERAESARVVHDLGAVTARGDRVGGGDRRSRSGGENEDGRDDRESAAKPTSRLVGERTPKADRDQRHNDGRADERENAEHRTVGLAIRQGREILRQARARERPARDRKRRPGGGDEEQAALHALGREEQPERENPDADDESSAREREHERERRDVHEQSAGNANSPSMRALRAEPEAEHDRDVGEQRERIPVIDRLVEARDALVLRESGHGLCDDSPHQRRTDDDGEHRPRQTGRLRTACRREHEPEPEEHGVRDALVECVPAAIADDRPPDRHTGPGHEEDERPDEHRSRATQPGRREPPERNGKERADEQDESGSADRQRPADAGSVAGEHRAEQ